MTDARQKPFRLEEATIEELHAAIRAGETTVVQVVDHYIARASAYNGVASLLVTEDGASVQEATGTVRAGMPLRFPTETVAASTIFPDLDKYQGAPLEFGRMEATASDPTVQQQYGMIAGKPDAGQLNALATLNIRGERSVTCKGEFDRHPSEGPLPRGAPPVCDEFRHLPDARETAAALDARYGRNPPLDELPMYGVVFSFKDPFDTKDMRTTAGGDAAYDIDFPARDHILVERLRETGAIIFAQGGLHRIQRPRRQSRRPAPAGEGLALDPRLSAQQLGRQPGQCLRHDARRLVGLELGLGRLGQRQPRHVRPRRGDPRLDPRPGQP
jgi:amidase